MPNALVIAETSDTGEVKKATLSAISFAKQAAPAIGGTFSILVLGSKAKAAALALTGYGAEKVIACEDPSLEKYTAEHYAPTVAEVGKSFSLLVATATS